MKKLECKAILTIDCENESLEEREKAFDLILKYLEKNIELKKYNFELQSLSDECVYCCRNEGEYKRYCDECIYKNDCEFKKKSEENYI